MKKNNIKRIVLSIGLSISVFSSVLGGAAISNTNKAVVASADASSYYSGISDTATGTTLLGQLRSLNSSKKTRSVGYSSMGTSASGQFKYTDYDPNYTKTDSKGQVYGTRILSFYSGTSTTSFNREHTWPQSHGGTTIDDDIHMTRPTIASENGSRGNSFYVEGMKSGSLGWDPAEESFGKESYRGDAARIIFYCVVANSQLGLLDTEYHNTSNANPDYKMGKLSTLLEWNLRYPVLQREQNRNAGAEYLQGNRNPFIDHPEYACKIWGDTNETTKGICGKAVGANSITLSPTTATIGQGSTLTIKATTDNGSTAILWKTDNASVATVSDGVVTGVGQGTATITAYSSYDSKVSATAKITVKAVSSIAISGTATKTSYFEGDKFNPAGLTVTATYSDKSTSVVSNSSCKWYDGTVNTSEKLVKGSTSVKCVLGSASAIYSGITVDERQVSDTYTLLTSESDLVEGNQVIFAYNESGKVAGNYAGSKYLTSETATFSADKSEITNIGNAQEFTLGKSGDSWTFTGKDGVLGAADVKKLVFDAGTTTWNITPGANGATSVTSTNSSYGSIQYNTDSQSPRFMNYGNQGAESPIRPSQLYIKGQKGSGEDVYDGIVKSITLSKTEASVYVGDKQTLTATVNGEGKFNPNYTWSSSNESIVTVDNNGVVTGVGVGWANIIATSVADPTIYQSCVFYVSNAITTESEYTLVTSDSMLQEGRKVIFAYNESNKVAGSYAGSKYLTSETATFSADKTKITDIGSAQEFTLGKSGNNWTFTGKDGVLGAASVKKLVFDSGTTTWDLVTSSSGVTAVNSTNSSYGSIQYNTSSDAPRFMNYGAQGDDSPIRGIQLYVKKEGATPITEATLTIDGESSITVNSGDTGKLTYTYTGVSENVTEIYWVSSDEDIILFNDDGNFVAGESGTVKINLYIYTSDGAGFYYASMEITVIESRETTLAAVRWFIEEFMHMEDYNENLGWCKDEEHHYYVTAKEAFNELSSRQREAFLNETEFNDAKARLQAWATANGDTFESGTNLIIKSRVNITFSNNNQIMLIAIISSSLIMASILATFLFLKKRKHDEK